ncbi:MAG: LLM class flavin-dependent oxidoreductase [Myxococcota bacterium]
MQRALLYQVGDPGPEGFETMREELRLAESLGLDAVWCFPNAGEAGDFGEGAPAIWLAALAPSTERIRLGWGLPGLLPPMRPPIREAEQAASLDIAASGRLELALLPVGALEGTDERPWDEGLRMLVAMWEAPVFSWASERFRVAPVSVVPRPGAAAPSAPSISPAGRPTTRGGRGRAVSPTSICRAPTTRRSRSISPPTPRAGARRIPRTSSPPRASRRPASSSPGLRPRRGCGPGRRWASIRRSCARGPRRRA